MDRDTQEENDRQQELFALDTAPDAERETSASDELTATAAQGKRKPTFEEALARLEQTVARLESADISLDESLRLFQEGTRLSRICSELLESIEHRITQLVGTEDGEPHEVPFAGENQ